MAQSLNQVPPDAEVWVVEGRHFLIWYAPNTQPPVPLAWFVESSEERQALGIDTKKVDKKLTWKQFAATGALRHGTTRELANTTENPFDQILSNYETEVKVKPWLADPEVLAIWAASALEGRAITDSELQGTEWWRTHSDTERQWLSLNASDPATADQLIADNRLRVADMFRQAGIENASEELISLVADNWTTGTWSEVYATTQIQLLSDPATEGTLDSELTDMRDGLNTTRDREEDVRQMMRDWLGPAYEQFVGTDAVTKWAGKLRNNPDARTDLADFLRRQFQTHYNPAQKGGRAYGDDPDLRYGDIAPMWRNVFQQTWGEAPDETSDFFMEIVRANDLATAQKRLRDEGLKQGNETVTTSLLSDIGGAFGGGIRSSDPVLM